MDCSAIAGPGRSGVFVELIIGDWKSLVVCDLLMEAGTRTVVATRKPTLEPTLSVTAEDNSEAAD
jgi:hypothetical protein